MIKKGVRGAASYTYVPGPEKDVKQKPVLSRDLVIYIDPAEKNKIDLWVQMAKGEISGFGLARPLQKGVGFLVSKVFLPFQECGSADTEANPAQVAAFMAECLEKGIDTGEIRFWWHSHQHMGVFWSGTDTTQIDDFKADSFYLSAVFNKKGEVKARIDLYKPFRIAIDDVPLIQGLHDFGNEAECKRLFDERVKEKTYTTTCYGGGYYGGNGWWDNQEKEFVNGVWRNKVTAKTGADLYMRGETGGKKDEVKTEKAGNAGAAGTTRQMTPLMNLPPEGEELFKKFIGMTANWTEMEDYLVKHIYGTKPEEGTTVQTKTEDPPKPPEVPPMLPGIGGAI